MDFEEMGQTFWEYCFKAVRMMEKKDRTIKWVIDHIGFWTTPDDKPSDYSGEERSFSPYATLQRKENRLILNIRDKKEATQPEIEWVRRKFEPIKEYALFLMKKDEPKRKKKELKETEKRLRNLYKRQEGKRQKGRRLSPRQEGRYHLLEEKRKQWIIKFEKRRDDIKKWLRLQAEK